MDAVGPIFGANLGAEMVGPDWEGKGRQAWCDDDVARHGPKLFEGGMKALNIQLLIQDLPARLLQEQIARVKLMQHFKEQSTGGLDLACAFLAAGIAGKDQAGHAGYVAKLAASEFGRVDTGDDIFG